MKPDFNHLDVIPHDQSRTSLTISPINRAELESLWPVDASLRYTTNVEFQYYFDSAQVMYSELSADGAVFGMYAGHNRSLIGFCALMDDPEPEVLHYVTDNRARGMGYGTISKIGLAALAFENHKVPALTARTLAVNTHSIASLKKAGFICVGTEATPVIYSEHEAATSILHWRLRNPDTMPQKLLESSLRNEQIDGVRQYLGQRAIVDVRVV